jgi:hypothetical protein
VNSKCLIYEGLTGIFAWPTFEHSPHNRVGT